MPTSRPSFSEIRRPRASLSAVLLVVLSVAAILSAALSAQAQQELPGSVIAGVTFPQPARIWFPDPQRSQAAALNALAAATDRSCSAMEFHIWYAETPAAADDLRSRTDVAFTEAGWALEVIGTAAGGERDYVARRPGAELVMSWTLREGEIGLLLCAVGPAPQVPQDTVPVTVPLALDQVRAEDGTPLPRPRPDPNAALLAVDPATPLPALVAEPPAAAPGPVPGITDAQLAAGATAAPTTETTTTPLPDANGDSRGSSPVVLIVLAIALGAGAFVLFRLGRSGTGRGAGAWPTAIATIVYSQVASETKAERGGKESVRYIPVVAYEYEIDGALYRAARLRFGDAAHPQLDEAKATTDRYPIGAGIEVHYNPAKPAEAVIEVGGNRHDLFLIGGVALAAIALATLISALA